MAGWLTITALAMLFVATFVFSYRQRFARNPVRAERVALGVAIFSLVVAILIISLVGMLKACMYRSAP